MNPLVRYARTRSSPYLRKALESADPDRAALGVYNHTYHLLHYGDPVAEYWALVNGVTIWDVAVERQLEISGPDAFEFVQRLVPRDLTTCAVGQCKYVFLTNESGGIIADPVLMRIERNRFRLSISDADVHLWCRGLAANAGYDVAIRLTDIAPVQIQGPKAKDLMVDLFGDSILDLEYYRLVKASHDGLDLEISRTGWSTELGYEVYVHDAWADDAARAERWWDIVMKAGESHGIRPIAPNQVRRIEAGILAHGCDIDEDTNPFEVDMGYKWMIDLDQPNDFVGKRALRRIRDEGRTRRMVGVDLSGRDMGTFSDGAMPEMLPVLADGRRVGTLTSACWSPRLEKNIGFAMVEIAQSELGTTFSVPHPTLGTLDAVAVQKPHWDPERRAARA